MAGNKRIASIDENGDVTFNHQDHQLSGNLRTDSSGAVVKRIEYYPFGRERLSSGSYNKIFNQYTDQYKDGESDLYYYNQRYYNPVLGRFISGDPLYLEEMDERGMDTQEVNVFGYVRNNPLKYTDSTGMFIDATGAEHAGPANPSASASEFASPEAYEAGIPGDAGYDPGIMREGTYPSYAIEDSIGAAKLGRAAFNLGFKGIGGIFKAIRDIFKSKKGGSPSIDPKEIAGKTPFEIDKIAREKGLIPKGPDPKMGQGAYVDPVTGKQRVLSHPNGSCGAHCHVNNSSGQRLNIDGDVVPSESIDAHLPLILH